MTTSAPATAHRVLIALGGNAMTGPDGSTSWIDQNVAIKAAMEPVADLLATGMAVTLTHGNGPQVGNVLTKNELAAHEMSPVPLDWCGAQTQATIGFTIQDALESALAARGAHRQTVTVVTRTRVDESDPGFTNPTKPIGRYLPRERAELLIAAGQIWQDRGAKGWRRVVASPEPLEILDAQAVCDLGDAGYVVIAAGGGGIPVVRQDDGRLRGIEAVIDKDLTAALLARSIDADVLVIATDVDHAVLGYGTPDQQDIGRVTVSQLEKYAAQGHFGSGSMAPKVEAVLRFARSGHRAVITSLEHIGDAIAGDIGTIVVPD
ncbi:carbamate kinase [Antricoccus suffuscus]|uniref:Carbamate kinase n=1 Tax=Antricoccus suffuscus TaxID=1629062 RepID=A0A2T0ZWB1_9ACTN|nr:carbamate kinase [Antricoccus suffuscus]PRZ40368.1 carbamate kinase [Antricoccus suffuscus]